MGKRILVRRRGKAGIQFRSPAKGKFAPAKYPFVRVEETLDGIVADLKHEPGRGAPLAQVAYSDGSIGYLPAVENMAVGARIMMGAGAQVRLGNVLPLGSIPEGSSICNIERTFGDGGELVRAAGGSAILFSQTPAGAVIRLPSRKSILLRKNCRATMGKIAGSGRLEKPLLKAGTAEPIYRKKGQVYPRVRGIAMAAVYHPFGGGRHQHPGKSTSTSRNAPPGRKVGHIAPRRTGRKRVGRARAGA